MCELLQERLRVVQQRRQLRRLKHQLLTRGFETAERARRPAASLCWPPRSKISPHACHASFLNHLASKFDTNTMPFHVPAQVRGLTQVEVSSEEEALAQYFLGEQVRVCVR